MDENKVESPVNEAPKEKIPEEGKNTTMAIIAYLIFFVPLLTDAKNDPFVKYHVKQGLALFILFVVNSLIGNVISFWFFISGFIGLGLLVLLIMGIINAANGKMQPVPVIGKLAEQYLKF
jgi:uncharacterized membrane protein